jgi:hypothetical protein
MEPAAQHPWRPDPDDSRTPIAPPDTIASVNRAASRGTVFFALKRSLLGFVVQAHEHGPQQLIGHVLTVRHFLADGLRFAQQALGFRHFHGSTVGRLAVK